MEFCQRTGYTLHLMLIKCLLTAARDAAVSMGWLFMPFTSRVFWVFWVLNLILLSGLNSHQSTNRLQLYKRRLRTDEASGMGILATKPFIGTSTKCSSSSLQYQWLNGSLTDSSAYELRSIWLLLISCTFPSPCYWLPTANCDNASATGVALLGPLLLAVPPAATMVRVGDTPPGPIFSLTAWRPHPNDKAASPASRVQQP